MELVERSSGVSSPLIDMIYEAGAMPQLWPGLLQRLSDTFGVRGALLMAQHGDRVDTVVAPSIVELMNAFVAGGWLKRNSRTSRLLAQPIHPGFVTDLDLHTEHEVTSLPLYTEFLIPSGIGAGVATIVPIGANERVMLAFEGTGSHERSRELVPQLDELRPHLARAALLSARLQLEKVRAAVEALAVIGTAAAMIDRSGHVLAANADFETLLGDAMFDRNIRLTMRDQRADRLFANALGRVNRGLGQSFPAFLGDDERPVAIHLVPVSGAARDIFLDTSAVMIVARPHQPAVPAAALIQALFDLTPSEARVARRIAEGHAPQSIAYSTGVGLATVRSQLKAVFQKTGTGRQADLVRLLVGVAAPPPPAATALPR